MSTRHAYHAATKPLAAIASYKWGVVRPFAPLGEEVREAFWVSLEVGRHVVERVGGPDRSRLCEDVFERECFLASCQRHIRSKG